MRRNRGGAFVAARHTEGRVGRRRLAALVPPRRRSLGSAGCSLACDACRDGCDHLGAHNAPSCHQPARRTVLGPTPDIATTSTTRPGPLGVRSAGHLHSLVEPDDRLVRAVRARQPRRRYRSLRCAPAHCRRLRQSDATGDFIARTHFGRTSPRPRTWSRRPHHRCSADVGPDRGFRANPHPRPRLGHNPKRRTTRPGRTTHGTGAQRATRRPATRRGTRRGTSATNREIRPSRRRLHRRHRRNLRRPRRNRDHPTAQLRRQHHPRHLLGCKDSRR